MHRAGGAIALACALAGPVAARDLLILEAGGLRDSGHDVGDLVDDFLSQQGAFSGLALQPSYSATLDYLGIADAFRLDATAFGTQVVLSIPSTGFTRTFTGTSPEEIESQIENFFEGDGVEELAEFFEETHERTALALLDGNPRSTTALFARGAFDRFGLGAPRTRAGFGRASAAEWGHFDLAIEVGGGAIDVDEFSPLTVLDGAITAGGDTEPGVGVYLSALGQYRNYDGADIYDAGLELGVPIALLRPGAGSALRWTLTPVVQAG
jgi:hypothetical protein